ncbi:DUF7192 family protein [Prescottella equi]
MTYTMDRVHDYKAVMTFNSVLDLVNALEGTAGYDKRDESMRNMPSRNRNKYYGRGMTGMDKLTKLAAKGLPVDGVEAVDLAEHNLSRVDREIDTPVWGSYYDVAGSEVDVARYLTGEPECMVNYHTQEIPRAGRVIELVVSICTPHHVSPESVKKRGEEIMSVVLAIESLGLQCELWADCLITAYGNGTGTHGRIRVRLKDAGSVLDPGQVMFALTHVGMLRGLVLGACHLLPSDLHDDLDVGSGYGYVFQGIDKTDYSEHSVFIPSLMSDSDARKDLVQSTLRELGIIE